MRNKKILVVVLLLLAAALAGTSFAMWFDLSALPAPGHFETYIATKGKEWVVYRDSRREAVREPPVTSESSENGQMIFQSECVFCHGSDGREPSDVGRNLYPRAPALGSVRVQNWSDPELFWIIQNGIRLSGMPGFGKQLSHQETWDLVRYVRSLNQQAHP